jgi:hypothetical protein
MDAVITLHIDGSLNQLKVVVQGVSARPPDMVSAYEADHNKVAVKRWFMMLTPE